MPIFSPAGDAPTRRAHPFLRKKGWEKRQGLWPLNPGDKKGCIDVRTLVRPAGGGFGTYIASWIVPSQGQISALTVVSSGLLQPDRLN